MVKRKQNIVCDTFATIKISHLVVVQLNSSLINLDTLDGIVEIFTFMEPLIRLRRNPYVRKPVQLLLAHINVQREKRKTKRR